MSSQLTTLSAEQRSRLRAQGHHLNPVVLIGQHGLTPTVLKEIDRALSAHELIKIRIFSDDRDERITLSTSICTELSCQEVQRIGKLLLLWRHAPELAKNKPATPAKAKVIRKPRTITSKVKTAKRMVPAPRKTARKNIPR